MGANSFTARSKGKTAKAAFDAAVEQALYDYGHAGYTGSIAEKESFVMIELPEGTKSEEFVEKLIHDGDKRINDKWGPAGCIKLSKNEFLFFGWASS